MTRRQSIAEARVAACRRAYEAAVPGRRLFWHYRLADAVTAALRAGIAKGRRT